jgi:hypothetical protein
MHYYTGNQILVKLSVVPFMSVVSENMADQSAEESERRGTEMLLTENFITFQETCSFIY